MKILIVGAEMNPFIKAGGLGDVMGSLPKALSEQNAEVFVMIPAYKKVVDKYNPKKIIPELAVPFDGNIQNATVYQIDTKEKYKLFLVGGHGFEDREEAYGYSDDVLRFIFFSKAVIEAIQALDLKIDVIHANDWHTGILPVLMAENFDESNAIRKIATVYTIHNLAYQGLTSPEMLGFAGLPSNIFIPELLEFYGQVNLMKGGILWSDIVTTVSETYAKEIQTPKMGEKLDGVISARRNNVVGILNGIDPDEHDWQALSGVKDLEESKKIVKASIQKELGLEVNLDIPLLAIISRLVEQKGLDLFGPKLDAILAGKVQLVILGTGQPQYEDLSRSLEAKYPGKVSAKIGFDAKLAERIYCGADIFLMPSRFEPCGLGQMIALNYGTIPVVRAVGGLAETIHEWDSITATGNGFKFCDYTESAFVSAIERALDAFGKPSIWAKIKYNAVKSDFTWTISAKKYMSVFERAIQIHRRSSGALKAMPQLRKDPIVRQWVIISTERSKRPSDYTASSPAETLQSDPSNCPFCSGHEMMTPPEVFSYRPENSQPDAPGWDVRVFDNRFPALVKEEYHSHAINGIYASMDGVGAHEVVVETPNHFHDLPDLSEDELTKVVAAYKNRYLALSEMSFIKYVLIFRNHGKKAGASLFHPHSQIIATPIIPKRINDELSGAQFTEEVLGKCPFCAMIEEELKFKKRVVLENDLFVALCPYAARFPFETWILPKRHMASFGSISPQEVRQFSSMLGGLLGKLKNVLNDPPYNFMIHSAPSGEDHLTYYHWHLEIIPRLTIAAGFEWGSDFYINPTPPEEAAKFLRGE